MDSDARGGAGFHPAVKTHGPAASPGVHLPQNRPQPYTLPSAFPADRCPPSPPPVSGHSDAARPSTRRASEPARRRISPAAATIIRHRAAIRAGLCETQSSPCFAYSAASVVVLLASRGATTHPARTASSQLPASRTAPAGSPGTIPPRLETGDQQQIHNLDRAVTKPHADRPPRRCDRKELGVLDRQRPAVREVNVEWLKRPGLMQLAQLLNRHTIEDRPTCGADQARAAQAGFCVSIWNRAGCPPLRRVIAGQGWLSPPAAEQETQNAEVRVQHGRILRGHHHTVPPTGPRGRSTPPGPARQKWWCGTAAPGCAARSGSMAQPPPAAEASADFPPRSGTPPSEGHRPALVALVGSAGQVRRRSPWPPGRRHSAVSPRSVPAGCCGSGFPPPPTGARSCRAPATPPRLR